MKTSISTNAVKALLYEVSTGPKPGLVDGISSGPHPDMNIYLFIDSSLSLQNYFISAERIGQQFHGDNLTNMFTELRKEGIKAEKSMFSATNNINTHKGAIFALGIFVCAESYRQKNDGNLFEIIRRMTHGLVKRDLKSIENNSQKLTAGEKQFKCYGLGGARAEAEAGYPIIENVALPFLKKSNGSIQCRLLDTLMKLATVTEDSNLIKRAGTTDVIPWIREKAQYYLDLGGYQTSEGKKYLEKLNQIFLDKNYSLGGCADLLIIVIFLGLEYNYI